MGLSRRLTRYVAKCIVLDPQKLQWSVSDSPTKTVSSKISLVSGGSPRLHSHGIPAPHWQPNSSLQERLGWFSHTHPMPKQTGQFLFICQESHVKGLSRSRPPPSTRVQLDDRTLHPYLPAHQLPAKAGRPGGRFRYELVSSEPQGLKHSPVPCMDEGGQERNRAGHAVR